MSRAATTRAPRAWSIALAALCALSAAPARATGLSDHGEDLRHAPPHIVNLSGYYRLRAEALENLDLSRGPTPSGQLLYPVPLADPNAQTLTRGDMRLRTDLAIYAPGGGVAVKARIDSLDNLALGSAPEGIPAGTTTQVASPTPIRIKRAYGEALTPFGLLAAGRMGSQWGMGMLTNGGDCTDCDSGDAVDRIAFVAPLLGHLWAAAYDFSATGPFVPSRAGTRSIDFAPSVNVHTLTFAMLRYHSAEALAAPRKGGPRDLRLRRVLLPPLAEERHSRDLSADGRARADRPGAGDDAWLHGRRGRPVVAPGRARRAHRGRGRLVARAGGPAVADPGRAPEQPCDVEPARRRAEERLRRGRDLRGGARRGLRERRLGAGLRRVPGGGRVGAQARRPRRPAVEPAQRHHRQQLPLPPRLSHRSHPVPRDHRHGDRRGVPQAPRCA